jgi:hypothetical protein
VAGEPGSGRAGGAFEPPCVGSRPPLPAPRKARPAPRQQPRNPSGAQWFPAVLGHLWARAVPRLDTLLKKTILGK